jgi:hypothetical protein
MTKRETIYRGLYDDIYGGMTDIGRIIKDAWVFGLLSEDETCAGWSYGRIQELHDKVYAAWEPHGHLVSRLPAELRERHQRIYAAATARARAAGWTAELDDED